MLAARAERIPLATLPPTFRYAMLVTRDLGVRYLWIDSLCILQDSAVDWEREAPQVGAVYEGGYVMLAARASVNCYGGCFPRHGAAGAAHKVPVKGLGGAGLVRARPPD